MNNKSLKPKFSLAVLMSSLAMAGFMYTAKADALKDGMCAFEEGRFEQAEALLRPYAQQGVVPAQRVLGEIYDEGKGVPRDIKEAGKWYRKAALNGDAEAQFNYGLLMYEINDDDYEAQSKILYWLELAAEQGHPQAKVVFESMSNEYLTFGC